MTDKKARNILRCGEYILESDDYITDAGYVKIRIVKCNNKLYYIAMKSGAITKAIQIG